MRQRVVVGVNGSPGSLVALHRATAEARERNADLHVVLAWQLPGGGLGGREPARSRTRRRTRHRLVPAAHAARSAARGETVNGPYRAGGAIDRVSVEPAPRM
ncbi:universal stress protein [Streptomyces sp. NPDC054995]